MPGSNTIVFYAQLDPAVAGAVHWCFIFHLVLHLDGWLKITEALWDKYHAETVVASVVHLFSAFPLCSLFADPWPGFYAQIPPVDHRLHRTEVQIMSRYEAAVWNLKVFILLKMNFCKTVKAAAHQKGCKTLHGHCIRGLGMILPAMPMESTHRWQPWHHSGAFPRDHSHCLVLS